MIVLIEGSLTQAQSSFNLQHLNRLRQKTAEEQKKNQLNDFFVTAASNR